MSYLYSIFMLFITVFLAWVIYNKYVIPRLKYDKAEIMPNTHSYAVLISKNMGVHPAGHGSISTYSLVFEFPDGMRKDFSVGANTYNTILDGDEGDLTYKELDNIRILVSFRCLRKA